MQPYFILHKSSTYDVLIVSNVNLVTFVTSPDTHPLLKEPHPWVRVKQICTVYNYTDFKTKVTPSSFAIVGIYICLHYIYNQILNVRNERLQYD